MKFIELFAGIGGFRVGLELAGHECVWANEWLERPRRIYKRNFGEYPNDKDIRAINLSSEIPKADLLTAGFPCATFSIAGKRTGFHASDARGTLFFEICRILRLTGIPYFLLENVKGLLNHDNGRTLAVMLSAMDEYGYDCQWEVLNSKNFGVPQNRERIFVVGNLRGKPRPKVFPIGETSGQNDKSEQETQGERQGVREQDNRRTVANTIMHRIYGGDTNNQYIRPAGTLDAHYKKGGSSRTFIRQPKVSQFRRGYMRDYKGDGIPTLTANMGTGGHNVPFVVKPCLTPNREKKRQNVPRFKADGDGVNLDFPDSKTRRGRVIKGKAHTLMAGSTPSVIQDTQIRKLTPLECERLQGLPDNFTKYYDDGTLVSDSERYERCGRTVTINVIEEIGRKLGYEWY